jgi:hypothetical protein
MEYLDIAGDLFEMESLFEDLGTFKKVRNDLAVAFRNSAASKSNSQNNKRMLGKLKHNLGKDSEFTLVPVKTGIGAVEELKDEDSVGLIFSAGSEIKDQFMAIFVSNKRAMSNGDIEKDAEIMIAIDMDYVTANMPDCVAALNDGKFEESNLKTKNIMVKGGRGYTLGKARVYINAAVKALKKDVPNAHIVVVKADKVRADLQPTRYARKKGVLLTPKEYEKLSEKDFNNYAAGFKRDFKNRLDKFKISKAIDTDSPEEFLAAIKKNGYIDKIKYLTMTYKYSTDNFNFRVLKNKEKDQWNASYVEYEISEDERYSWAANSSEKTKYEKLTDEAGEKSRYYELRDKKKAR